VGGGGEEKGNIARLSEDIRNCLQKGGKKGKRGRLEVWENKNFNKARQKKSRGKLANCGLSSANLTRRLGQAQIAVFDQGTGRCSVTEQEKKKWGKKGNYASSLWLKGQQTGQ